MTDDLLPVLTRFHREVMYPEMKRLVEETVAASERRVRDEMHTLLDAQAQRLDRLETEYHMLVVGLKRVEDRLDRVDARLDNVEAGLDRIEQRLDKVALRSELLDLKNRVDALQEQVRIIEARLEE